MLIDQSNILSFLNDVESVKSGNLFAVIFSLAFMLMFVSTAFGQWSNDPRQNRSLIQGLENPVNISTVEDSQGGAFIFWQNKSKNKSDVYFQHIDLYGNVSFRADGKKVRNSIQDTSKTNFPKSENPVATNYYNSSGKSNSASIVVWREISANNNDELFVQKVFSNGNLGWNESGIQISKSKGDIINYSITSDNLGNTFICFIEKSLSVPSEYSIYLQKISADGKIITSKNLSNQSNGFSNIVNTDENGIKVHSSSIAKNLTTIIPDGFGGVFVFWIENSSGISKLFFKDIIFESNIQLNQKPIVITETKNILSNYKVLKISNDKFYLIWQTSGKVKKIFHQIFNTNEASTKNDNSKLVSNTKGIQSNPQIISTSNSTIVVSWIEELNKDKNIYLQKFRIDGNLLNTEWNKPIVPYNNLTGEQFSQVLTTDKQGNVLIAWFDLSNKSNSFSDNSVIKITASKENIYAQKVDTKGNLMWNPSGFPIAIYPNSNKSYLSIVSDQNNGLIAIFKEIRGNKAEIFGQRIFYNQTYTSQIINLKSNIENDEVILSWQIANEYSIHKYSIEKLTGEGLDTLWVEIGSINADSASKLNTYNFIDKPDKNDTYYYRIAQIDLKSNRQYSDVIRVNFVYEESEEIVLYQNTPNPFTDSTTITYYLPKSINVKIEFYNSRLEKIDEKNITNTSQGKNRITFYGKEFPTGVYFYRFIAGNFVDVKKMVIAR